MHAYSALITGVDHNVGRILKRLEEMGQRENTLVVFTADQGWNAGHHGVWGKGNGTWPFNMYEESIAVPLIWNHPGRIKPGLTPNPMVSSYDYFPTILDYLGIPAPPDRAARRPQLRRLRARRKPALANRLYFDYAIPRAIRTENLKFVERSQGVAERAVRPRSRSRRTKNVIDDPRHRRQLETLRADLDRFFERSGAPPIDDWRKNLRQKFEDYSR